MLLDVLPKNVREYVENMARLMQPNDIYVCEGSDEEYEKFTNYMVENCGLIKLNKLKNCVLALTDPHDVARVESKTVISSERQIETIPTPKHGFTETSPYFPKMKVSKLGNWMSHEDLDDELSKRLPGCMKGRTMYVIPFSMGPVGGPISKVGLQLTDSAYVVNSMKIMTRMGMNVIKIMHENPEFVKCVHSVGVPLPTERKVINHWPCNPEMTIVSHIPDRNEIISYGSGYGGNSLLGKKCFALRLGSILAKKEGWLAEHMLIVGITNPQGVKKYIAAAFPSQCGKTNLAMMTPSLPGWKVECVGDDIAWMKFDSNGVLRAINPENGFFGVAPGTNMRTNPIAMRTIQSNTMFTNVGYTTDGDVFWEDKDVDDYLASNVITWKNEIWSKKSNEPAAHPNSRFTTPARQCPIIDSQWESPEGVPISAILFGGRRPTGVPLVYESYSWEHGVMVAACMRSEVTSAAEYTGKVIMHDPFGMRPFFGYNFGDYCTHWLSMNKPDRKMPKIFHVNWFRKSEDGKGKFIWPGFGENIRVLDWILKRCDNVNDIAEQTQIGLVPKLDSLNLEGLTISSEQLKELMSIPVDFWKKEIQESREYFEENVYESMPKEIYDQLAQVDERLDSIAH